MNKPEFLSNLFAVLPSTLRILFGDGIITGSLSAIILNLVLNKRPKESIHIAPDSR